MDKIKNIVAVLITCFIVGFTVGFIYRKVEKFNKDYSSKVTDRSTLDDFQNQINETSKLDLTIGNIVTIGTEQFYIISSDDTNVRMLAKYNLDIEGAKKTYKGTGLQDENVLGTLRWSSIDDSYGTIAFTNDENDNYWNYEANSYVYNEKSNLYNYIENYVSYLNSNNQINVKGNLLTYEDIIKLGCNSDDYSCANAPKWLTSSTYWLGSTDKDGFILIVSHPQFGKYGITVEGGINDYNIGIRPVIEISKEELKKFDIKDNNYKQLEEKYTNIKYIEDSKYIVVVDNDNNLKLIDANDKLISNLYTFDNDKYFVTSASYKITEDRMCIVSQNGIYIFVTNGLKGNDEKLYVLYYNDETDEKTSLIEQDIMGAYGELISCK